MSISTAPNNVRLTGHASGVLRIEWDTVPDVIGYDVEVVSGFTEVLYTPATDISFLAEYDAEHSIRVRGFSGSGPGPWSDVLSVVSDGPAVGTLEFVSSAGAEGDTIDIPYYEAGDVLIVWGYRPVGNLIVGNPSGWTSFIDYRHTSRDACRLSYRVATNTSLTSVTVPNAEHVICVVYRGQGSPAVLNPEIEADRSLQNWFDPQQTPAGVNAWHVFVTGGQTTTLTPTHDENMVIRQVQGSAPLSYLFDTGRTVSFTPGGYIGLNGAANSNDRYITTSFSLVQLGTLLSKIRPLSVVYSGGSAEVSWIEHLDANSYDVEIDGAIVSSTGNNVYSVQGLPSGVYSVRVRAVNESTGVWSDPVEVTIEGEAISHTKAILHDGQFVLYSPRVRYNEQWVTLRTLIGSEWR